MRITRARMAVAGLVVAAVAAFGVAAGLPAPGSTAPQAAGQEAAKLKIVKLRVENMSCAACPYIVREALASVDGVVDVKVDYATRTATVVFDPTRASVDDLTAATGDLGYPSQPLAEGTS